MSEQMCEQRRERLRALMREQGIEALLISHAANRYYLSGFELHDVQLNESAGRLIVMADGKDWILTDSRYLDAARAAVGARAGFHLWRGRAGRYRQALERACARQNHRL